MIIRTYHLSDTPEIRRLFYETVRKVNRFDYTPEQVEIWSLKAIDNQCWCERLQASFTYVAEADQQIVGFANLEPNGHIDCFYCRYQYQGKGIGSRLLQSLETIAQSSGIRRLFTEASITAKPFFQRRGFNVLQAQYVALKGVQFLNFKMEKFLQTSTL